ncbi:microfibrillar-associated protein 2 isoform X2 [Podarcis lilfordi]|uniref:Microfibrillar-associated protein 2 isoform X2 n=2 Tax=Podarcis lilfordi TaxID=74358 RepID=A0AA35PBP9_9SAUR|nr:microfibrillar-associated protein 2 isoform X2 [Podarcis lilfordi]
MVACKVALGPRGEAASQDRFLSPSLESGQKRSSLWEHSRGSERKRDLQSTQQDCPRLRMRRTLNLFLLCLPALLAQGQYDIEDPAYHDTPYVPYEIDSQDYYDYAGNADIAPQTPEEQYQYQSQQQNQQEVIPAPTQDVPETEPTEPGPLDCQEEQYPCTRLYSVHKPCKQCLNEICFYSLRRVYVINKEICIRTICAHEELLRADLCRDKFSKCGVMATSGLCQSVATSCVRSCGGC